MTKNKVVIELHTIEALAQRYTMLMAAWDALWDVTMAFRQNMEEKKDLTPDEVYSQLWKIFEEHKVDPYVELPDEEIFKNKTTNDQ